MKTEKIHIKELIDHWTGDEHAGSFGDWAVKQGYTHAIKEVPEDGLYLAQWTSGGAVFVIKVAHGYVSHSLCYATSTGYSDDSAGRDLSNWRIIRKVNLEQLAEGRTSMRDHLANARRVYPVDAGHELANEAIDYIEALLNAEDDIEEKPEPKLGETWEMKHLGEWYAGHLDLEGMCDLAGGDRVHRDEIEQIGERIVLPGEEVAQ